ncbi:hypothetical protein [Halorientalis sp.]|uniref:hypothetical protein n=1 Tax=Halorientalis sp. TaxID=1931229 RepID=UPI002607787B|nr:hypothetical protein [Halorientalis sp.]
MSPAPDTDEYEATVGSERESVDAGTVESLAVTGERCAVDVTPATDEFRLALAGDNNSVRVRGSDETVVLDCTGDRNSLALGEEMALQRERDEGEANSISRERFETEREPDLVRTTRDEAYASLGWFGVDLVSYQTSVERDHCRYCGHDAERVIERREEKVLSVFGLQFTLGTVASSDECSFCREPADTGVNLSDRERREIYR